MRRAGNYLTLSAAEATGKLFNFAAFTHLGRTLGPEQYGLLEFTLAVMAFFTLSADMGLSVWGAREVAKNPRAAQRLVGEVVWLRAALSLASAAIVFLGIQWLPKPQAVRYLLYLYGASLLLSPLLVQWYFQGREEMHWVAAASVVRNGVFAALVLAWVRAETPLWRVGWIECAAVAAAGLLCATVAKRRFGVSLFGVLPRGSAAWRRLTEAMPIGLAELTWASMWYLSTTMLGFWRADASLGWFGASHRVVMALHTFVWLYFYNLLPAISRAAASSGVLPVLLTDSLRVTAWGSLSVVLLVGLPAHFVLPLAFGSGFAGGGWMLAALTWMIPVTMLSGHYRYLLIASGLQKWLLASTTAGALAGAAGGLLLIPRWGASGAVVCLLGGAVVDFACAYGFVQRRLTRIPFLPAVRRPFAALAISALAYGLAADRLSVPAAMAISAVIYVGLAFLAERELLGRCRTAARPQRES
ncbi:MAG: oligosaccharide flippase family protein [Bryobacterales bacterium]|nr:oligosaccharide flippase family protein [Bryobacteraceae bacterium]MDW8355899.1 oligosaccharide flippase family protein [Bryobacterales bacterium]